MCENVVVRWKQKSHQWVEIAVFKHNETHLFDIRSKDYENISIFWKVLDENFVNIKRVIRQLFSSFLLRQHKKKGKVTVFAEFYQSLLWKLAVSGGLWSCGWQLAVRVKLRVTKIFWRIRVQNTLLCRIREKRFEKDLISQCHVRIL
jgi:hypothetical protein